ncbi:MAG: hypothetical protein RIM99_01205 [Cyclobacteriaceae bacterium]
MTDVIILTCDSFIDPQEESTYVRNALLEDQLVTKELTRRGLSVKKVAWSDPHFDWTSSRYALFRTTWDYAENFNEFADWLMASSMKTRFINSYDLISWNLDKHYMDDLKNAGLNIVETCFIEPKDPRTLKEIHKETGWTDTVLKPCVSASAKDTFRLSPETIDAHEGIFSELIANESMMLQPFQTSVIDRGEISLMLIDGAYTHAVIKKAKEGDFRVQDDFGGTVDDYEPSKEEIDLALKTVNSYDSVPLYARVDIINDNHGNPAVTELELIEPEMWFRKNQKSVDALGRAVSKLFS